MEISHVIRGEDHLSNTPKHILLFRALGHPEPLFAHLPLILNADRTKMSKRKSQTAVSDYIAEGFIREALVNYLALLGWATGTEEEVLSIDQIAIPEDIAFTWVFQGADAPVSKGRSLTADSPALNKATREIALAKRLYRECLAKFGTAPWATDEPVKAIFWTPG